MKILAGARVLSISANRVLSIPTNQVLHIAGVETAITDRSLVLGLASSSGLERRENADFVVLGSATVWQHHVVAETAVHHGTITVFGNDGVVPGGTTNSAG